MIFVNDVAISDNDVYQEMQYHPAVSLEQVRCDAARALVIRQLLLQAAQKQGLLQERTEEAAIAELIAQEVRVPQADEDSCRRYYQKNPNRFLDSQQSVRPFDEVKAQIGDYLQARSLSTGIHQYIRLLAGAARIQGFEIQGSEIPLVAG